MRLYGDWVRSGVSATDTLTVSNVLVSPTDSAAIKHIPYYNIHIQVGS